MQALNHGQILDRISEFYHDDFLQRTVLLIQPDEIVVWAGSHTDSEMSGGYDDRGIFGYSLITSDRVIQINFRVTFGFFGRKKFRVGKGFYAADLPASPLKSDEVQSRHVYEVLLGDIQSIDRSDPTARVSGRETTVIQLVIVGTRRALHLLLYSLQDGQEVYEILQNARRSQKQRTQPAPDIADQLEKLVELHRYQTITDEEYEAAKKRLLG